ncbi:chemotaxis protein CheA [Marinobacterium nitratireducens]|uniref:Chemotaxis protein CheA n=1 Tax=Marinobacterium nitratireducens TaxID=518897 RepID=A0A917ZJS6_9GAMM|nr:chemotaxis protein CheA [Marinobacterium nitratireducens]GGO85037.1 chemotaxis protein CheA [Marinobacterium nitratireducens]
MGLDVDQEILEDFLIEAGEILEQLSEQLVDLEQRPQDRELLNAIFRGFHTVKGGAGFLQIEAMVECCHQAENLFDLLRTGELQVSASLMDLVLQALDAVNRMFGQVRAGDNPEPASPQLLQSLAGAASGQPVAEPAAAPAPSQAPGEVGLSEALGQAPNDDLISEDEFESLLDELHGSGGAPGKTDSQAGAGSDRITEDEFESLLDELHGSGGAPGRKTQTDAAGLSGREFDALLDELPVTAKEAPVAPKAPAAGELITDDEFEDLLDKLQAEGKGAFAAAPAAEKPRPPAGQPEPVAAAPSSRGAQESSNVRVDTRLLDTIMNMVGELVLVRNRLVRLGGAQEDEEMAKALGTLDMVTADLQTSVMKTRMQPVKKVFGRFPRLIRDLSRNLKKEIRLELRGEETDLDKNLVEALADPLIHLVRNAVDHGIEAPAKREQLGKPREGLVLLSAEQEGDHILLVIQDDGGGMDPNKLRKLAVQRGMLDSEAAARLSDQECFNLIFAPGFSTKSEISDVSGRGVGMDVVKTKITQLNGTLAIDSVLGQGTRIAIQVPLTLAIMPTLMVILEQQAFALPLVNVNEIFNLDLTKTNVVDGQRVIVVRDQALPLFHLKRWLVDGAAHAPLPKQGHVVIVTVGTQRVGFVVDQLVGQEEVVIKPLGSILHGTPGLSGATITGDGRIALIIDLPNLLKRYAS